MSESTPQTVYLNEYQVSAFLIEKTELVFDLGDDYSLVTATLTITRNPQSCDKDSALMLHGSPGLDLQSVSMDGQLVSADDYSRDSDSLTIYSVPELCTVTTVVRIQPQLNTTMMGLYRSRTMYCTQCEAEGFPRYYLLFGSPRCDVRIHHEGDSR